MQLSGKRILFLNWKDIHNPSAGGAEVLTDALASHLAEENEVLYITSSFPNAPKIETINGYTVIRAGNIATCMIHAFFTHDKLQRERKFDLIIDQVHGVPFFSLFYTNHPRILTLIHEVAGDLWSTVFPRAFGKHVDAFWLWLYKKQQFITVSQSTKQELMLHRIPESYIHIVPNFCDLQLSTIPEKTSPFTLIVLGRIAPGKRIEHAIEAFRILKKTIPEVHLIIIGKSEKKYSAYDNIIQNLADQSPDITIIRNANDQEKTNWLKQSHILLMPSKKEGYGIAILEAAACGTPAIGYNVAGIRDAIIDGETGLLAKEELPEQLAKASLMLLQNSSQYAAMKSAAFLHAQQYTAEHTLLSFEIALAPIL